MLEATELIFTIEPPPRRIMPGIAARQTRYIESTLIAKDRRHASSSQSIIVPLWTQPAQLNITSYEALRKSTSTAVPTVTSKICVSIGGASCASDESPAESMSVATTAAPSRAKARAVSRPIPFAAAVISALFPSRRLLISVEPLVQKALVSHRHWHGRQCRW